MDFLKKLHTNVYVGLAGFVLAAALWFETSRVAGLAADAAQFPRFVLVLAMLDCAYLVISGFRSKEVNDWRVSRQNMIRVGILLVAMLLYVLLIGKLGYVISTIALLAIALQCFSNRNHLAGGIVTVAVPILMYLFFSNIGVRLPVLKLAWLPWL